MKTSVFPLSVQKYTQGKFSEQPDLLAIEEPLEIRLNFLDQGTYTQKNIAVTMRTPGHDFELVAGFLFTEGIIPDAKAIQGIRYCENVETREALENSIKVTLQEDVSVEIQKTERNFYMNSSCGVCGKASIEAIEVQCSKVPPSPAFLSSSVLIRLAETLQNQQVIFSHTGALHAAALFDFEGSLLSMREDVGRHNALDKLIGGQVLKNTLPLVDKLVWVSGRVSFELVQKALKAGISTLVAVGAPSSLAVQLAQEFGMTLIGFARAHRFNVYCGKERIRE